MLLVDDDEDVSPLLRPPPTLLLLLLMMLLVGIRNFFGANCKLFPLKPFSSLAVSPISYARHNPCLSDVKIKGIILISIRPNQLSNYFVKCLNRFVKYLNIFEKHLNRFDKYFDQCHVNTVIR